MYPKKKSDEFILITPRGYLKDSERDEFTSSFREAKKFINLDMVKYTEIINKLKISHKEKYICLFTSIKNVNKNIEFPADLYFKKNQLVIPFANSNLSLRAWDKDKRVLIKDFSTIDFINKIVTCYVKELDTYTQTFDNLIFLTSSGFLDSNGIPIYEGDLLEEDEVQQGRGGIYQVVYYDGCFQLIHPLLIKNKLSNRYKNRPLLVQLEIDVAKLKVFSNVFEY